MSGLWGLCLWTCVLILLSGPAQCSNTEFLARGEGDSVVLSCLVDHTELSPIGVYLKRSWLRRNNVLFQLNHSEMTVLDPEYQNRISVSGDPSIRALNVTISDLRPADTDRYYCEFILDNPWSEDTVQAGNTEFFLLVHGVSKTQPVLSGRITDWSRTAPCSRAQVSLASAHIYTLPQGPPSSSDDPAINRGWVNTCVGGSALLSCARPAGDSSAVEGVILKRQRGGQPVELLYDSKTTSRSSQFSVDRIQLSTAPGPGGISYSLTVGQMQSEDSGLYSCELLVQGQPPSRSIGHQGLYVSVQAGDHCRCSSYSSLIYSLSAAVGFIFVLILVLVLVRIGKCQRSVTTHTPAPIYEEMTGLQPKSPKRSREHLEEAQSEYRNVSVSKPRPENHYESSNGALAQI